MGPEIPGPGTYDPLKSIGANALKMSLHGRIDTKIVNDVPGPGSYDAIFSQVTDRVHSPSLRNSLRGVKDQQYRKIA